MTRRSAALSAVIIALLGGLGIGLTMVMHQYTAAAIDAAQEEAQAQAFLSVMPPGSYDNQPLRHPLLLPARAADSQGVIAGYLATRHGEASAIVFRSQAQGYSGPIELLIAVAPSGQLLGVKVLKHTETSGIGARLTTEPTWLAGFLGTSITAPADNQWALKKDQGGFDQIAGATITSRATVSAIRATLRYFDTHKLNLLTPPASTSP